MLVRAILQEKVIEQKTNTLDVFLQELFDNDLIDQITNLTIDGIPVLRSVYIQHIEAVKRSNSKRVFIDVLSDDHARWHKGEVVIRWEKGWYEPLKWLTPNSKKRLIQTDTGKKHTVRFGRNCGSGALVCDKDKIDEVVHELQRHGWVICIVGVGQTSAR